MNSNILDSKYTLFKPVDPYSISGGGRGRSGGSVSGTNPLSGAVVSFFLRDELTGDDKIRLDFLDNSGDLVRSFRTNTRGLEMGSHMPYGRLEVKKGMNHFSWNLTYPGALEVPGMIMWSGSLRGPGAVPGNYTVRLVVNGDSSEFDFNLLPNPLSETTIADQQEQFDFLIEVREKPHISPM